MVFRLLVILLLGFSGLASASLGYYRFPDLHNNTLVFTAEGDLWIADINHSNARRLTTHPAEEKQASISPDGKQVAFSANYEGNTEVYVIPIQGGIAKRVSFENSSVRVQGWTTQGEVLFSSIGRTGKSSNWMLIKVNPETLETKAIPLADAVEGTIDRQNNYIYFTQFGLQISGDNNKIYRGGATGEIWKFNLNSNEEAIQLTSKHVGSVRQPMLYNKKLYFISDSSGNDNIWSMDLNGKHAKQVTQYKDWPVRSASMDNGKIVFQLGADINLLNLKTNKSKVVSINLVSDFPNLREHWVNKPLKYMTSARLAGKHNKVVITARGKVAVTGTDKSRLVEIATDPQSRTRNAILSNDGKWVYAINDASGELEIWKYAADGSKNAKRLTTNGDIFRWNIYLSPDGKWLAHDDKNGVLWLLNTDTGDNKKIISNNNVDPYSDVVWSSDSQLLAITRSEQSDQRNRILLYSISDSKQQTLTSDKYNSYSPAFSSDGNWLYFLSDRHFNASPRSPWGDRNLGLIFDRRTQIFAYALTEDAKFPFQKPHELNVKEPKKKDKEAKEDKSDSEEKSDTAVSKVEWENIADRLWQVPVKSGNYYNLTANAKYLYVQDRVNQPGSKPLLKSISIKPSTKVETYSANVANYQLSNNGKKIFVRRPNSNNANMFIVDANGKFPSKGKNIKVTSRDWQLLLDPKQEWRQLFHDAWLMHRDSLFDKNMRGIDWQGAQQKYQPLLDRLTDRYELNDIFSHMMGELNALHSQVRGGDVKTDSSRPRLATLGATYSQSNNGVIIEHIYQHDRELPNQASPLMKPGVNAKQGDIIKAINGIDVDTLADLNKLLINQAGKQVLLSLQRNGQQIKTVAVPNTTNQERRLRYKDWVNTNRGKVINANDEIGYLHLYAMGSNDIADFAREFYTNYEKHGLIIDVRRNRGGNIDSWIIEKLLRRAWAFWKISAGSATTNMQQTFRGHLVVLADEFTYSDGETFIAGIKALNLAPVIGKRSAGAGVWLSGGNRLSDNGMARVAEYPQYAMDGRWIVEGHGIAPNIEVNNLPHETFNGKDAQLQAAIDYLEQKMKKEPIKPLKALPFSNETKVADDIN